MGGELGMMGPLGVFAPGFGCELMARGYRPGSTAALLELTADVSAWLAEQGLMAGDLTDATAELLMSELRAAGRSRLISSRALSPLLEYLRGLGVVPSSLPAVAVTATEMMIERYSSYLLVRRGLARSTVRNYLSVAREFFSWARNFRTPGRSAGATRAREISPVIVSIHSAEICARC